MKSSRKIMVIFALITGVTIACAGNSAGFTDLILLRDVGSCNPTITPIDLGQMVGAGLDWGIKPDDV